MNNKVNFLRGTSTEYATSTKDNDTFYYTTDDEKLYLGDKEITSDSVTIDNVLSNTSENPVQNKVINAALNNKADLSDIPNKLPADGGNADTVGGKHADEITGLDINNRVGIAENADVNNVTSKGYYYAARNTAKTLQHSPFPDEGFYMDVYKFGSLTYQVAFTLSGSRLSRYFNGTVWIDWKNNADGGNAASVGGTAVVSSAALGLHRMASGTDEATTTNCPAGCWYGKHS